jgi:dihydroorotate dehydrogenase electron transfer subunit
MILQQDCQILHQYQVATATYRLGFLFPELACRIVPGQFVMLRPQGVNEPLLGRAFALYDLIRDNSGTPIGVEVVYHVFGHGTETLSKLVAGQEVTVWGPLGNGFPESVPFEPSIFVAGGIGQTPFLAYAKALLGIETYGTWQQFKRVPSVLMIYGVRSAEYFAELADFESLPISLDLVTEDGSKGFHGRVTSLLQVPQSSISNRFACGPVPMLKAVAEVTKNWPGELWVSLETPMACGFGACFSCVVPIQCQDGNWDYVRSCIQGPVFKANELALDRL